MAERLKRYRPLGVSIPTVPTVDYVATGRAQARAMAPIQRGLDSMTDFALKKFEERALIEGAEYGAENAPTKQQLQDAQGDIEDLVPGDQTTVFGRAARKAALQTMTTNFEVSAREQMINLQVQAELQDMDTATFTEQSNAIIDGYTSTLQDISPSAALTFRATMATVGNSALLAHSKAQIKRQQDQEQFAITSSMDIVVNGDATRGIPSRPQQIISEGSTTTYDENGNMQHVSIREKIDATRNGLKDMAFSVTDKAGAEKYLKEFDDAIVEAINTEVSNFVLVNPAKHMRALRSGEIEDAKMRDLFMGNLNETQRKVAIKAASDAWGEELSRESALNQQIERNMKRASDDAVVDWIDAFEGGDEDAQDKALSILRDTNPEKYTEFKTRSISGDVTDNADAVEFLEREKAGLTLTSDAVVNEWVNGNIGFTTFKTYMSSVKTLKDRRFAAAGKILRYNLGLPELPSRNPSVVQRDAERKVSAIMDKLTRKSLDPNLPDDFDPVEFVDKEIDILRKRDAVVDSAKLTDAKQKVRALAVLLKLPPNSDVNKVDDALAESGNSKYITDYGESIRIVKNSQ
jgi:hypothetical protein